MDGAKLVSLVLAEQHAMVSREFSACCLPSRSAGY